MAITALTPGIFSASEMSIDVTLAWACGLKSNTPNNIPSGRTSEGYFALPDALSRPSSRGTRLPITLGAAGHSAMAQAPFVALAAACAAARTPMYVPQRQMLPSIPLRISSSVAFGCLSRNALTAVTKPGVQ